MCAMYDRSCVAIDRTSVSSCSLARATVSSSSASAVYATAAEVATRSGDIIGALHARIGEAKVLAAKGNLPAADALLEDTVARASEHELTEVRSIATHDRSY